MLLPTVLLVGRAAAHVEISAEPARAGAANAMVSFDAEAESATAGIRSIQVQLPDGIMPTDVTWQSGPPGWTLQASADGYTMTGPPLPAKQNAQHSVQVRQLPDAPMVAFKTLVSYPDGQTDRWIELPTAGGTEPENPAPLITVAPAAPAAMTTAPMPTSSAPAPGQPAVSSDDDGLPAWARVGRAVIVGAALGGVVWLVRRRTSTST